MKLGPIIDNLNLQDLRPEPSWNIHKNRASDFDLALNYKVRPHPLVPNYVTARATPEALEPIVDVDQTVERIPLRALDEQATSHMPAIGMSIFIHGAIAGVGLFGLQLPFFQNKEPVEVVEVTFGLEVPTKVAPKQSPDAQVKTPEQEQAAKLPEQLPQLPSRFEVETKQPDAKDTDMPLPESAQTPLATPTPKIEATPAPKAEDKPKAIVAPERDKDAQKIEIKDVMDRMKREDRKVGDKDVDGQKEIPKNPLDTFGEIPKNPIPEATDAIPDMPTALAPSGSLSGRRLAGSALEAYRTAATVHMKRYWSIPGLYNFESGLEATAAVVVDLFGKIRSLEIEKSSGNADFDDLVLKQIRAAEPFPDFPDNSARIQKLYMKFNPQTID